MKRIVAAVLVAGVLAAAGPAAAKKPVRGCPDSFTRFTTVEIFEMFPTVTQERFDQFDKNGDGTICGKRTPGIFNAIDNTANRP